MRIFAKKQAERSRLLNREDVVVLLNEFDKAVDTQAQASDELRKVLERTRMELRKVAEKYEGMNDVEQ